MSPVQKTILQRQYMHAQTLSAKRLQKHFEESDHLVCVCGEDIWSVASENFLAYIHVHTKKNAHTTNFQVLFYDGVYDVFVLENAAFV